MSRNINQSARLLAGMLAALATGEPYHLPSIQIPRESNSVLDELNIRLAKNKPNVEAEIIAKAKAKQARKAAKKSLQK